MTLPNADNDLLMDLASSKRLPEAAVFLTISDPAKSTNVNVPVMVSLVSLFCCTTVTMNKLCDLELPSFIKVALLALDAAPISRILSISEGEVTKISRVPTTLLPLIFKFFVLLVPGFNKSRMFSL